MCALTYIRPAADLPPRKPMASARRVSLFEREIRVYLGTSAIEVLFAAAQTLSEGQRQGHDYFGSTMITIDLGSVATAIRDECDVASARRVADLLARDARAQARIRALAEEGARARAGAALARLDVEVRVRAAGTCVHVDVDVEGEVAS